MSAVLVFRSWQPPFKLPVFSDCHDRASVAARALVELAAMRWTISLRCAREHCVTLMPASDWHEYAIEETDQEETMPKLVGNANHMKMASMCEWLDRNANACKAAAEKLELPTDTLGLEDTTSVVADCKIIVGIALAVKLVTIKEPSEIDTTESRSAAVKQLKDALSDPKAQVPLLDPTSEMLDKWVSAAPKDEAAAVDEA